MMSFTQIDIELANSIQFRHLFVFSPESTPAHTYVPYIGEYPNPRVWPYVSSKTRKINVTHSLSETSHWFIRII